MNKPTVLRIVFVAVILIGVTAFLAIKLFLFVSGVNENIALTKQLAPAFIKQLNGKQKSDFPYLPGPIAWDGKYLQIDDATVESETYGYLNFVYNKERNEKLNTARFFPGNDLNGVVWLHSNANIVGQYSGGGQAFQPYYVLFYIDLKQNAILAQDTLWGSMPPKSISATNMGGVGKAPKEQDVIQAIKDRMGD
ncbi:MAG: hypothetical protein LBD28_01355 [Tannerellaceae bacterium]|jgi:hypothetical protein|nr:hypothetical protein [Tannerellaceae bacterium]